MSSSTVNIAVIGAGRIGKIHAKSIHEHPSAQLTFVADVIDAAAAALADELGAQTLSIDEAISSPEVDAIVIASPTQTHAQLISQACDAKKAVFCEKPIALGVDQTRDSVKQIEESGITFLLGFNRRFDPTFAELKAKLGAGLIGSVERIGILSRDPSPPPAEYIKQSGGLFKDMMIHDLDMARWLLDEEPTEIMATASCLIDPEIAKLGDVDSAEVVLKTASGRLCHITNSRRAVYGYDQRIEVLGSQGALSANNMLESNVAVRNQDGYTSANPEAFFLERYAKAYTIEMDHFIQSVLEQREPNVTQLDGLKALELAEAAETALREGRTVNLK